MHRQFRRLLSGAVGSSEYVIALYADIRGFSLFSQQVDSVEVGSYIKRAYIKMIDDYFKEAQFFKPTGDGLLVVYTYKEETLTAVANSVIRTALQLIEDFKKICQGDPIVNFATPPRLGIGIARGSACRKNDQ
jgi:class 3 adenylate cyclase